MQIISPDGVFKGWSIIIDHHHHRNILSSKSKCLHSFYTWQWSLALNFGGRQWTELCPSVRRALLTIPPPCVCPSIATPPPRVCPSRSVCPSNNIRSMSYPPQCVCPSTLASLVRKYGTYYSFSERVKFEFHLGISIFLRSRKGYSLRRWNTVEYAGQTFILLYYISNVCLSSSKISVRRENNLSYCPSHFSILTPKLSVLSLNSPIYLTPCRCSAPIPIKKPMADAWCDGCDGFVCQRWCQASGE